MEIGSLPKDATEVVLDVTVKGTGKFMEAGKQRWSGRITLPVQAVPTLADAVIGTDANAIAAAVRDSTSVTIEKNQGNPPSTRMWVSMQPQALAQQFGNGLSLSLKVEILDGDRILDSRPMAFDPHEYGGGCFLSLVMEAMDVQPLQEPGFADRLTLRVSGDREAAFRDLRADSFWSGSTLLQVAKVTR